MSDVYHFDPRAVKLDESTFRVDSSRAQDIKSRALAAYFAPSELTFAPFDHPAKPSAGGVVKWLASASPVAVLNRLDVVLGQDGWSERYETLPTPAGIAVRCTIRVRFAPDADWVDRSAVGTGASDKAAHREAFERAAVKWGVARYLYDLPPLAAPFDPVMNGPATPPELPQACLPIAYRKCGEQAARPMCDMLEACLEAAKVHKSRHMQALATVAADAGVPVGTKPVNYENRHVTAIMKRIVDWRGAIEKGSPHPAKLSPFAGTPDCAAGRLHEPAARPTPTVSPAPAPAVKPAAPTELPVNGAEMLARLEAKDRELTAAKRIAPGALVAHVMDRADAAGYPADPCHWTQDHIREVAKWVSERIAPKPSK